MDYYQGGVTEHLRAATKVRQHRVSSLDKIGTEGMEGAVT